MKQVAKDWFLSKTLWGAVIMLAQVLLQSFDIEISTEEIEPIVDGLITILGTVLVVYGRTVAEGPLK